MTNRQKEADCMGLIVIINGKTLF